MISPRSDVVGSLLRPRALREARDAFARGEIAATALREAEDRAVDEVVALQEEAGLEVVTDGEMRRLSFQSQMTEAVEGFGEWDLDAFLWGDWRGESEVGDRSVARPPALGVVSKLRPKRPLSLDELRYLRSRTRRIAKVTLPSPSLWANFWSRERSAAVYPTLDSFLADVVDILRTEVAALTREGATYLQLDAPHYGLLLDPRTRAFYERQGWSLERWLSVGIEMDNAVMAAAPGVTFGVHVCRGNQESRWLASGGYETIARAILRDLASDRLLLEYDDERSGDFGPLAEAPDDKIIVLGLVTTKSPRRETPDELAARIHEAAKFVPLERLALSPQCGFSTSVLGNRLTPGDQKRKLAVVAETARRVWG